MGGVGDESGEREGVLLGLNEGGSGTMELLLLFLSRTRCFSRRKGERTERKTGSCFTTTLASTSLPNPTYISARLLRLIVAVSVRRSAGAARVLTTGRSVGKKATRRAGGDGCAAGCRRSEAEHCESKAVEEESESKSREVEREEEQETTHLERLSSPPASTKPAPYRSRSD